MASVYVFNATPIPISLTLNQIPISGTLSAIQSSNGYSPNSVAVARNTSGGNPGTNQFGGQNTLVVVFNPSGPNPGPVQSFSIPIDPNAYPIVSDLQLYVFYGQAALISPSGAPTESAAGAAGSPMLIEGQELSGAEAESALSGSAGSDESGGSGGSGGSGSYGESGGSGGSGGSGEGS